MSLHDYAESQRIGATDASFTALIMAAMRRADSSNAEKLRRAFPSITAELQARYNAPGGKLPEERLEA